MARLLNLFLWLWKMKNLFKKFRLATIGTCIKLLCLLLILKMHHCFTSSAKYKEAISRLHNQLERSGNSTLLCDYLQKSRHWEVRPEFKRTTATPRADSPYLSELDKFCIEMRDNVAQSPFAARSTSRPGGYVTCFSRRLWPLGYVSTTLEAELLQGVLLHISETRPWTRTSRICSMLDAMSHVLASQNMTNTLFAEGSIIYGNAFNEVVRFSVENADCGALYGSVKGWINCGEPGSVEILCRDAHTGEILNKGKSEFTREYVGWDVDRTHKFFFESSFCVDGDGMLRQAEVDVVFKPLGSSRSRLVFSTNTTVRTWIR